MTVTSPHAPPGRPAGGQTIRIPSGDHTAEVHAQLYRYAEDLQQISERHTALASHYQDLLDSSSKLLESHRALQSLMRISRDMHFLTDLEGKILQANPATGKLDDTAILLGSDLGAWIHPDSQEHYARLSSNALLASSVTPVDHELTLKQNQREDAPLFVTAQAIAVRNGEQQVSYLHWVMYDVTPIKEKEFDVTVSSLAISNASEGVMITDASGRILSVNPAFTRITGYTQEEIMGKDASILNSGQQDPAFYAGLWESLTTQGLWSGRIINRKKSGELYTELLSISAARDTSGKALTYVAVFKDLPQKPEIKAGLEHLAHHDALTALPNRLLLQDRLKQVLALARRTGTNFSLIFIDLDKFKCINDRHGHSVGDAVLKVIAQRLLDVVREVDTVARLGGDEFIILTPGLTGEIPICTLCQRVLDVITEPIEIDGLAHSVSASIGIAEYPKHGEDERTLLHHADKAMYNVKSAGGSDHRSFDPTI